MRKEICFAAGCFWGIEHYLKFIQGVFSTEVGYANGVTENPTYQEVYTDTTGYAEAVYVRYETDKVSLHTLLDFYFRAIDPLSLNRQGNDVGTRYRTGIYYLTEDDLPTIQAVWDAMAAQCGQPLQVEVLPLISFYKAEEYHQDYLEKNPTGYCHLSHDLFELAQQYKPKNDK